ncbi:MAG: hypothetical protein K0S90_1301 [Enterobacteriaceae bacterium]|jgi:hypothetical protein|nr:hypothetical protein [Enterobacteriaceae bacterium]
MGVSVVISREDALRIGFNVSTPQGVLSNI